MNLTAEVAILFLLCMAVGAEIVRLAQGRAKKPVHDRIALLVLGLAFLMGGILKAVAHPTSWVFVLYLLGVYLCYTAMLFSFPGKEVQQHE